jgi:hypothetical protein
MNDVLPKNVNIPTRTSFLQIPGDRSSKECIHAIICNGKIQHNRQIYRKPSPWAETVLRSLPDRIGRANSSNGWTSVEVKIGGEWQSLDVHRKRFLNKSHMTNIELHILSF